MPASDHRFDRLMGESLRVVMALMAHFNAQPEETLQDACRRFLEERAPDLCDAVAERGRPPQDYERLAARFAAARAIVDADSDNAVGRAVELAASLLGIEGVSHDG